jgi:hypothetical protein
LRPKSETTRRSHPNDEEAPSTPDELFGQKILHGKKEPTTRRCFRNDLQSKFDYLKTFGVATTEGG